MDSDRRDNCRSESKVLVGHKRKMMEFEETSESSQKSMKGEARIGGPSDVVKNATCRKECNKFITFANEETKRGFYLDLNAEDTCSSIKNDNRFYHLDNFEHVKSRDDLACENDSVRVWEGLKRNNYMSAREVVPVPMPIKVPKARGTKKCNDVMKKKKKKKMKELMFAKVAAPSGLLNELNPGIINHVRNSKQVYSIIKAVVRSETTEKKAMEGPLDVHTSRMEDKRIHGGLPCRYNLTNKDDHDELEFKLSSENASSLSNEESGNLISVTSLSSKAANIASRWLELVNQDINGRLAALQQSKKRVRTVITKELPLLMSNELSSNLEKDGDEASANAHADRWSTIFEQMENSLSEEETILENWLNQVNNMQLHCERGLSNSLCTISEGTDRMGNKGLWEAHISDKDLAVGAAAASIYSTCNFLLTMGNQPCC